MITQCEASNFFLGVRKNIERLTYANYFIELIDIVANEHDQNIVLYNTLVDCLNLLSTEISAKRVARIFELKFLDCLGFSPQLDNCTLCNSGVANKVVFSVPDGGVVCGECRPKNRMKMQISLGALNFMRKISKSDIEKTAQIKVSKEVGKEIEIVLRKFLAYYVNIPVKSLRFLEQIKRVGIVK